MPTALAEWTTERPDVPGFYWWRLREDADPETVELFNLFDDEWNWTICGSDEPITAAEGKGSLWWPVRLDPPPVG